MSYQQPSYGPAQDGYPGYQQQPYYGQGDSQSAPQYQPGLPAQGMHPWQAAPYARHAQPQATGKRYGLRGAEGFWYALGCVAWGAAYFSKLPGKKAACEVFSELQLDGQGPSRGYSLNGMETFWYVLMCLWFGAGYFAKVSAKKGMWELVSMVQSAPGGHGGAIGRAMSGSGTAMPYQQGY